MILLLVFMQLTRDLFAKVNFLFGFNIKVKNSLKTRLHCALDDITEVKLGGRR